MLVLLLAATGTAVATGLGAIPVSLLGRRAEVLRPFLLGVASGTMAVASLLGLLLPGLQEGSTAAVLAGALAGVLFLGVVARALDARDRRTNLLGAFALGQSLPGRRVALLDDVVTTGSTVAECARVLRVGGAVEIEVWAIGRADGES